MKPESNRHREAIDKVAEAIDQALIAAVRINDKDGELDLDSILLPLAEGRAHVVMAQLQAHVQDVIEVYVPNDQPRVYADEMPKPKKEKLPKLKPQGHDKVKYKPGISKLLKKPISWDCPKCHAKAGTFCFKFDGPGAHPKLTTERNDGTFFHTMRSDLATAANDRIRQANILP